MAVTAEKIPSRVPSGGHLPAIDVVRFLTLGGVILVHSSSLANGSSLAADGVLVVFHITRSVFLLVSAFVLTLSYQRRPAASRPFWRRRFPLVVVPYVVWSAIYFVTGSHPDTFGGAIGAFALDLLDGGAHFHLYFLLLTFQLYLIFPLLMAALRRWPRAVGPAVVVSLGFQLAFTAAAHYGWRPPVLSVWFTHPSSWLASYAFYVVAGVAAADHIDGLSSWVRAHYRLVIGASVASVALAITSFLCDMTFLGYSGLRASEVFQPVVVVEAVTATLAQLALGLWLSDRAPVRLRRRLEESSDISFGVFLAHPLLIAGILSIAGQIGLSATIASWPGGATEALIAFGLVPFVYLVTAWAVHAVRSTRWSMALTGRPAAARP